jgi:hypothetical protein
MTLNPPLRNGRIDPALEIAVPDLEELVPPQYCSDGDSVFREYGEDLQRRMVIRTHDAPHVFQRVHDKQRTST